MNPHRIRAHTLTYAPWREGADEREQTGANSADQDFVPDPSGTDHAVWPCRWPAGGGRCGA